MTKEMFDKVIKMSNGCPVIGYGDNMLLFNINHEENYLYESDDALMIVKPNVVATNCVGQQEAPFECVICEFEMIQYMKILPDRDTLMQVLAKYKAADTGTDPKHTDAELKKCIQGSGLWKNSSPRGVNSKNFKDGLFNPNGFVSEVLVGRDAMDDEKLG